MSSPRTDLRPPTPAIAPSEWVAIVGVACVGVAMTRNPATIEDGPVLCPFRLLTGVECPGCGTTRAWVYAGNGQWGEALSANPFGVVLLVAVLFLGVFVLVRRVRRAPAPVLEQIARTPWVLGFLGLWAVFGVLRAATPWF